MRFPFIRSIIAISFQLHAPVADRQAAVDRVEGIVVGGMRPCDSRALCGELVEDGDYYVQIPDTTFAGILRALAIEEALPQVAVAHPLTPDTMSIDQRRAIKPR
jgi:hypothetical protein